jgi:hypothetical protein
MAIVPAPDVALRNRFVMKGCLCVAQVIANQLVDVTVSEVKREKRQSAEPTIKRKNFPENFELPDRF